MKQGELKNLQQIDLNGNWQFRQSTNFKSELNKGPINGNAWMPATVPGTVHTDLLFLKKIPDPFFGDNELNVRWVGETDWEYRRNFHVSDKAFTKERIDLVCEGLDTIATIYLNDHKIANCKNMFVCHRFNIMHFLKPVNNEIRIHFESPLQYTKDMERENGKLTTTRHSHRVYLRKAQYAFGWDWGPELPTSGIWRSIYLETFDKARIVDVHVGTLSFSKDTGQITIDVRVEKGGLEKLRYQIEIEDGDALITHEVIHTESDFRIPVTIPNPRLWWPNGNGEPYLYQLRITAYSSDTVLDEKTIRFGIRTVELKLKDKEGNHGFQIYVNGEPIFCKGADWIPADSFLPRVSEEKYKRLLQMTREASMNMLRVWGGGVYEDPYFYDMCDELGIMVWQDFMFACGVYPEDKQFLQQVMVEAEDIIRRLRRHPCLMIWCGNNENEWIWYRDGYGKPEDMKGFRIFHEILPKLCQKLDPQRPYWPTTPWGGDDPNSEDEGNRHSWDIWSRWIDYTEVVKDFGNFISEFGFQAPPDPHTLEEYLNPEDCHPESRAFSAHQKQDEGNERLFRFLSAHQKVTTEYLPFIYACQVNQAEALKTCIEHWRTQKFQTAGALIWQLNDCWPVISWSLIDSRLMPKASYYYAKHFFDTILLTFTESDEHLVLHVINDSFESIQGKVQIKILNFDGEIILEKTVDGSVSKNAVNHIPVFTLEVLDQYPKNLVFAQAVMSVENKKPVHANHFFTRYKWINFPKGKVEARMIQDAEDEITFNCRTNKFIKNLWFYLPGWVFSENYFDLYPNQTREVTAKKYYNSEKKGIDITYYSSGNYAPEVIKWIPKGQFLEVN